MYFNPCDKKLDISINIEQLFPLLNLYNIKSELNSYIRDEYKSSIKCNKFDKYIKGMKINLVHYYDTYTRFIPITLESEIKNKFSRNSKILFSDDIACLNIICKLYLQDNNNYSLIITRENEEYLILNKSENIEKKSIYTIDMLEFKDKIQKYGNELKNENNKIQNTKFLYQLGIGLLGISALIYLKTKF